MKEMVSKIIDAHKVLVADFEDKSLDKLFEAVDIIVESLKNKGCIYICGNGGSAADAQHITGEIVGRFLRERKAMAAVALNTDTSVMTSVANDYDFSNIFARQVEGLGREGDVLWALSTSGNSENVIRAVDTARQLRMKVVGFAGKQGSQLEKKSDVCINVGGENSYQIQQIHQIAYHLICNFVEEAICGQDK